MAIYDLGTASLAANGEVTGVGTTWKAPLTLIRVGATILFKTEPVQIYTISEIISDTRINVYNPNSETVPAGTGYAILAHDGITVQGLAQDVAETLRYYQSRESEVAAAVDIFEDFDQDKFSSDVNQVNTQFGEIVTIGAQVSANASQVSADKDSAAASAASASSYKDAAAASAQESADHAASLDTQNLLRKDLNFSDVADKAAARANLDVYSKSEIDRSSTYNLLDFHPEPNGGNTDSRPYIQAAIDYIASVGGGTLLIPKNADTFVVSSYGGSSISGHGGIIQLKSNVNIKLEGTIEVGPALAGSGFAVFVGFTSSIPAESGDLRNCHIFGSGAIDFGNYAFTNMSQLRTGIAMGRSYDCSVSGITFRNGDVTWAITMGWNGFGKNCVVHHCTFDNICQTNFNADHTSVYVGCPYSGVSDCRFYNHSERAKENACTVELHQNNQWYRDSVISGYTRGVYVVMHGSEADGAGRYSYNHIVSGISGDVSGQFCTVGAANEDGGAHLSRVLITGNNISSPDMGPNTYAESAFLYVGFTFTGTVDEDTSAIVVEGNNFYAPSAREDSYACFIASNSRGVKLSGNHFDCRRMVWCAGVSVDNFIWDSSNSIGFIHTGLRAGMNLFEMRAASFTNSVLDVALSQEDTSVYSVILFPSSCVVSRSKVSLDAGHTKNLTNTVVFEGNQQSGGDVYVSYPSNVGLTSYNTVGATYFYSDVGYEWVTSAYLLSTSDAADYSIPGIYTAKTNGQLSGVGWNDTATVRTVSARLMLRRGL